MDLCEGVNALDTSEGVGEVYKYRCQMRNPIVKISREMLIRIIRVRILVKNT